MLNNNFISKEQIDKEESLTFKVLNQLQPETLISKDVWDTKPKQNYLDLMVWTEDTFSSFLKDKKNINRFVNNIIIINGQFIKFAEENNVNIKCLYKESIVSWQSSKDNEKFLIQGVFLISYENCEFIHAGLFHKGNQNEDEISFFVLVSDKNYSKYVELRNKFDSWVLERDRSNSLIRVVGGEDLPYEDSSSWDDLILPDQIKKDVKNTVENFLNSKDFYLSNKIPWKTGIILFGPPGNGKTSIIKTIISNYNFKAVTIVPTADDNMIREAFYYAETQSPALLYFEDLDSLLERNIDLSSFLNLMDGISSKNGIMVVATANEVQKLRASVIDRPSRFDRKFQIPLPDQKMAYIYLSRWFGKSLTANKLKELSKLSEEHKFSYAYLKELYISSMHEAISKKRKTPTEKDVNNAVNRLMKEKNILNNKTINTEKYFK